MKKTMGETIADLRKERGMTQKDLAERMNVTDKAVSKWERDLSCPDIHALPRLAEVLGVPVEELLHVSAAEKSSGNELAKPWDIALRAVPLAMGIAVVVGSLMGKIQLDHGLTMLGIGMFCLSVKSLKTE